MLKRCNLRKIKSFIIITKCIYIVFNQYKSGFWIIIIEIKLELHIYISLSFF